MVYQPGKRRRGQITESYQVKIVAGKDKISSRTFEISIETELENLRAQVGLQAI